MIKVTSVAATLTRPAAVAVLAFALLAGILTVFTARAAESVVNEVIIVNPNAAPLQPEEVMLIQVSPVPPTRSIDGAPSGGTLPVDPDGRYANVEPSTDSNRRGQLHWDGNGLVDPIDMK